MKDVGKQPRLLKRGSTYYLRAKVPKELRLTIGKAEIKESLETGVYREAVKRLRAASARVDAQFEAATRKLSGAAKRRDVGRHELQHMAMLWLHSSEANELANPAPSNLPSYEERDANAVDLANELGTLTALTTSDDPDGLIMVQGVMKQLMEENGVDLEPATPAYRLLFGFVRRAMAERTRRRAYRLEIGDEPKVFDALFATVHGDEARPSRTTKRKITVDQLIERYRTDPGRAGVVVGTWSKYETVFRLMREELGATTPITDLTREDFAGLRDILNSLPANATKRFPKMRFSDLAKKAQAEGLKPMSVTTANNHLHNISSIFSYAVKEELVDKNRAHGMRLARAHERRPEERRLPFDLDQLQRIFTTSLYVRSKKKRKPALPRSGRFWVPLLSLWSGLRLNECCQLAVADVQSKDETDFILVRETSDGEQRLKTKAATRTVPIHPELKRIGFLKFVAGQRKAKHKQLFPDLPKSVRGYYSDLFSKWFSRFLRDAEIKTDLTSFHSFRHNFRDALREAHVHPSIAKVLGGWEDMGTDATYGIGYKPATLAAELEKISYPGLDLSHLHR